MFWLNSVTRIKNTYKHVLVYYIQPKIGNA